MSIAMTITHEFKYDVGTVLRMAVAAENDTGFRYVIVGHDFRRGSFGYLVDPMPPRPVFYEVDRLEPPWKMTPA